MSVVNNYNSVSGFFSAYFVPVVTKYNDISKFILNNFIPNYELENNLKELTGRARDLNFKLSEDDRKLIRDGFVKGQRIFGNKLLKNLAAIPFKVLEEEFLNVQDDFSPSRMTTFVDRFLDCFDENSLKEILPMNPTEIELAKRTQEFINENKNQSPFKGIIYGSKEFTFKTVYFLQEMIDALIDISGINRFIGNREVSDSFRDSRFENLEKWRTLGLLGSYPALIFSSLFIKTKSPVLSYILTCIICVMSFGLIITYKRHYSPCPKICNRTENLTKTFLEKGNEEKFIRENVLGRIIDIFNAGFGVLLIADSGVGKTSLMDSLPQYLQQEFPTSPTKTIQVFKANGGQINGNYNGIDLNNLANLFNKHADQVVFCIDEVESLFRENLMGKQSDLLLTFQDRFSQIICATTTKQYRDTIENEAPYKRRFVVIKLEALENCELKAVLLGQLEQNAPYLCVSEKEDIFKYIIDRSRDAFPNTSLVDASTSLLKLAIHQAQSPNFRDLKDGLFKHKTSVNSIVKSSLSKEFVSANEEELKEVIQSQKQLDLALKELKQNKETLLKINTLEKKRYQLKLFGNRMDASSKKWLQVQAKIHLFNLYIAKKRREMGLPVFLNKELIDRIVLEQSQSYKLDESK